MEYRIKDIVDTAVGSGKKIRLTVRAFGSPVQHKIKLILGAILDHFQCGALLNPLHTCIMELLNNALKANYKNVYFENYHPKNIGTSSIDYLTALQLFKLEIAREDKLIQNMAKAKNMYADIVFRLFGDSLYISVTNPVQMTHDEFLNVTNKLDAARNCANLTDYFLLNEHDPFREGAGLGLVLIMMILRSMGGDLSNLAIRSENSLTVASIIIPLNERTLRHYNERIADAAVSINGAY